MKKYIGKADINVLVSDRVEMSSVLQQSALCPVPFSISSNIRNKGVQITTTKLVEDKRLVFDVQDRISIQNGLDKLEKYSKVNKLKLIRLCIWKKKIIKIPHTKCKL